MSDNETDFASDGEKHADEKGRGLTRDANPYRTMTDLPAASSTSEENPYHLPKWSMVFFFVTAASPILSYAGFNGPSSINTTVTSAYAGCAVAWVLLLLVMDGVIWGVLPDGKLKKNVRRTVGHLFLASGSLCLALTACLLLDELNDLFQFIG